jgi:transcriptional regulator with XRE-family HTH domain
MIKDWIPPSGAQVKAIRESAGYTLQQMADAFGMNYRSWQAKESDNKSHRSLSYIEYHYLLLLCDSHPDFDVTRKPSSN